MRAWQVNENDSNRNRKYKEIDDRVAETYAKSSAATNKSALSDPYIKAIRWASDRIRSEGIVALVTNSGFSDALAADGLRKHLSRDFNTIYIVDLGGNVRKNPKLSGTTHNVFGIQVGVSINIFVRKKSEREQHECEIKYASADEYWTRTQKYSWLEELREISEVRWAALTPSSDNRWLTDAGSDQFKKLAIMNDGTEHQIFRTISNGIQTNRDAWVYSYTEKALSQNVQRLIEFYDQQVREWKAKKRPETELDDFLNTDDKNIKWSSRLKERLVAGRTVEYDSDKIRAATYRPFCRQFVYFDDTIVHRPGQFPRILPTSTAENQNRLIWLKIGSDWPFFVLASKVICDQLPQGGSQCFPFYTYNEDGTNRHENITDWALDQFRSNYSDKSIPKWDIFNYVYAVLHHPEYRERYAANLRRELPRIPFVSAKSAPSAAKNLEVFRAFVETGKRLAEIHVHYEDQPEYKLKKIEKPGEKLDYYVTKMRLSKDKTQIVYKDFLTLSGIPSETFEYRLGNRSALDWIIDQYLVSTDKRSGITNDPNRQDDKEYILRLIGQVITVSLETVQLVRTLPPLGLPPQTEPNPQSVAPDGHSHIRRKRHEKTTQPGIQAKTKKQCARSSPTRRRRWAG